jgi:tRNA 2-selenouridine synthase
VAEISVITDASPASLAGFDAVIDVRSPAEFAEDHAPGAENLWVLDDEERARVGTIYVQESRFLARRVGAALVARNIARHLEGALAGRPADFRPLVHCWRGGQRSNAMATVLSQVGWRVSVLAGGYRTYRRWVKARLYDQALGLRLVLLDGGTGSAKTEILGRLSALGVQTLDLEALAAHRGSLFGALPGRPQPSQKMFESRLAAAVEALDPARPVVVEAESSKVGERMIPPSLWAPMAAAPRIEIRAPRAERALYTVRAYGDVVVDRARLDDVLARLPTPPGRKRLAEWAELADAGRWAELAEALMELHYDPAYARSSRREARQWLANIEVGDLSAESQDAVAAEVARVVEDLPSPLAGEGGGRMSAG